MRDTDPLARVLDRLAPDPGVSEPVDELAVKLAADILHRRVGPDDQGFVEVRRSAGGLTVNTSRAVPFFQV